METPRPSPLHPCTPKEAKSWGSAERWSVLCGRPLSGPQPLPAPKPLQLQSASLPRPGEPASGLSDTVVAAWPWRWVGERLGEDRSFDPAQVAKLGVEEITH